MPTFAGRIITLGLALATSLLACQGRSAQSAERPPAAQNKAGSPGSSAGAVALDEDGPKVDLVASRWLWHLYGQGLVIPFAGEGFRKYSQEYTSPWRGVVDLEGHKGRTLAQTAAMLRFPWRPAPDEATMLVRLHGGSAGRKLSVRLNGKPVKNTTLDTGWQQVAVSVPRGLLVQGENTLALAVGKKSAVLHSVEIVPGKVSSDVPPSWPPASPVGKLSSTGKETEALAGFSRLMMPLEVPDDGWLVLGTVTLRAAARFRVLLTAEGQEPKLLLDEKQDQGLLRERRLPLPHAGKLAALELEIAEGQPGDAGWSSPRILLPKVASEPRPRPSQNLVVLVADALRADKLPMYGATRARTPSIAKAAESTGITFLSTHAASPSSPPSHATIQSGCVPRNHGILGDKSKVSPGTPMVSAILAKNGVATVFVGDASFAMRRLQPVNTWTEFHQPNAEGKGGDCSAVVKQVLDFAEKQKGKRFFASSVAFEAHTPYIYHRGTTEHYYDGPFDEAIGKRPDGVQLTAIVSGKLKMTPARWGQLKGLYDGEVEHLDGCFAALTDGIKAKGLADTPVVLLADHGEGFLEHGSMGHAYGQWAELTRVPLVFFLPGIGHGQKIATVVSHIDVVPTILDLMGVPPDPRVQGESLLPMMLRKGPWVPRVMPSEYGRSYSLRARQLHYVVDYSGNESLYDLSADPTEATALGDKRPLALRYFRDLAGIYLAHRAKWRTSAWGTLNNHRPGFVSATGP